jgi:hypothetical protein
LRQKATIEIEKSFILLFGRDKLMRKWKLQKRPQLKIENVDKDLDNLSSRVIGQHCEWLDGPLVGQKLTLNNAVLKAYDTSSANAFIHLLTHETREEEICCIDKQRVSRNGEGFYFLCKGDE